MPQMRKRDLRTAGVFTVGLWSYLLVFLYSISENICIMDRKLNPVSSFDYSPDSPSPSQISFANRVTQELTHFNLSNIYQIPSCSIRPLSLRKEDFLYVCICGVPPLSNQFANLKLPGHTITYAAPAFDPALSEEQVKGMRMTWQYISDELHKQVIALPTQPVVFVFHSSGGNFLTKYLHFYPETKQRIVGWVDIGGPSIRLTSTESHWLSKYEHVSMEQFEKGLDSAFEKKQEEAREKGMFQYPHKYAFREYFRLWINNWGFRDMCSQYRDSPRVLKCIIYGRDDQVYPQDLQSQKAIHFCDQLSTDELQSYNQAYCQCFGMTCKNAQEMFVFNLEDGKHTIHKQRKFKQLLPRLIERYLLVIERRLGHPTARL